MTLKTLQKEIEQAVPLLMKMVQELTWNNIAYNYKFILTEIKDNQKNFHLERKLLKKENDKKFPLKLQELMPALESLYNNLYDINLYVYRANHNGTIIDIRYYPKSSLDQEYRQKILTNPPMLHCKVATPPWLSDKKQKFDINWEHKQWLINWKMFWARQQFKHQKQLT